MVLVEEVNNSANRTDEHALHPVACNLAKTELLRNAESVSSVPGPDEGKDLSLVTAEGIRSPSSLPRQISSSDLRSDIFSGNLNLGSQV